MADWLARRVELLRHHSAGAEAVDELLEAVRQAEPVVDRPAERNFLGICSARLENGGECDSELYAPPGSSTASCRQCQTQHSVWERRQVLLTEAEEVLGTAVEISRAVTQLGQEVTPERVRQWAHRGRLAVADYLDERYGEGLRTRPLYRLGDVLDLLGGTVTPASQDPP
ncbi:hypothetical protein [Nonomuraea dietziae]|uniref:hypothetical protein n=1 Tax=Nonomuraea dietziae TaxID=65515 RepID=UPI00342C1D2D